MLSSPAATGFGGGHTGCESSHNMMAPRKVLHLHTRLIYVMVHPNLLLCPSCIASFETLAEERGGRGATNTPNKLQRTTANNQIISYRLICNPSFLSRTGSLLGRV
jgi:hypothetical protein